MKSPKKKAKKQAKKVKPENREAETEDNLLKSAKSINESSKVLGDTMKGADEAFAAIVNQAPEGQQEAAIVAMNKAKALLRELKNGADRDTIISKLKALNIK